MPAAAAARAGDGIGPWGRMSEREVLPAWSRPVHADSDRERFPAPEDGAKIGGRQVVTSWSICVASFPDADYASRRFFFKISWKELWMTSKWSPKIIRPPSFRSLQERTASSA